MENVYIEGITSVSALIKAADAGCARRKIIRVLFDSAKLHGDFRRADFLKKASARLGFEFCPVSAETIASHCTGRTHGGICAEVSPAEYSELSSALIPENGFCVLLDGAEDPYTLGNCIRTLWCCGADALILPHRLPDGADGTVCRSSAGTSELMPIFLSDADKAVALFRGKNYKTVCAGIRDSVPCSEAELSRPILLIVGGEKRGISAKTASECDITVRIPYGREFMGSMSTSSAIAVLAYEIMRRTL